MQAEYTFQILSSTISPCWVSFWGNPSKPESHLKELKESLECKEQTPSTHCSNWATAPLDEELPQCLKRSSLQIQMNKGFLTNQVQSLSHLDVSYLSLTSTTQLKGSSLTHFQSRNPSLLSALQSTS
ncbi:hypothetical protein MANES_06G096134v8 [Manihot esculenta]|uniref:Uncharacterized protein n=1 Tax=Manihot esculenta TaxID=3983 RepID=A0A251KNE7_MANES|nr:hypothetical protein MANES_06G096134v8 [Manihot esculenta]